MSKCSRDTDICRNCIAKNFEMPWFDYRFPALRGHVRNAQEKDKGCAACDHAEEAVSPDE